MWTWTCCSVSFAGVFDIRDLCSYMGFFFCYLFNYLGIMNIGWVFFDPDGILAWPKMYNGDDHLPNADDTFEGLVFGHL
jgi:hypothetical protein